MPSAGETEQTNVKVLARCRPFNSKEIAATEGGVANLRPVVVMEGDVVRVLDPERDFAEREAFQFDHALWSIPDSQIPYAANPFSTQEDVFNLTGRPAVQAALDGYHSTCFAFGQTSSGKSFTMLGASGELEGIAPRVVRQLFASVEDARKKHPEERVQFTIELSFMEIYNEKVLDLLAVTLAAAAAAGGGTSGTFSPTTQRGGSHANEPYAECRVRFHPERGTFVEGLKRLAIHGEDECLHAIKDGMEHRSTASTLMNDTSSRSHAIFQLCLSQKAPLKGTTRVSTINLVDLAGSERIKLSGVTGQALLEAKNINLSLSTLRRVIDVMIENSKLRKGQRPALPPYRESLLTWVLSDALGGNSKTTMVVNVSPYAGNLEDTLGTLRYGLKAKAIVCNARVNEERTAAVVNALRTQVDDLRRQLEAKAGADQVEQDRLEAELRQREDEFNQMQAESKRLDQLKHGYEDELRQKADELSRAQEQMVALENVEAEKQAKERELLRARELQAQTEQQLREQEEERRKKDAELAAVILRKDSLKRHHDRAAEEEARAKLAAEQARLRQFVSAFQNAFLLGKQRSGLDELKEEHAFLTDRTSKLQSDLTTREKQLTAMNADKTLLQRKVELLEKRCDSMQRDLEEVIQTKNKRVDELSRQRDEADGELQRVRERVVGRRDELAALTTELEDEHYETSRRLDALQERHQALTVEVAAKQEHLADVKEALQAAHTKLDAVDSSATRYQERIRALRSENDRKEQTLAELQRRRAALQQQREQARQVLELRQAELAHAQEKLTAASEEASAMRKNHCELRQFVSAKFFAVGDGGRLSCANDGHQGHTQAHTPPRNERSVPRSATRDRGPSAGAANGAAASPTDRGTQSASSTPRIVPPPSTARRHFDAKGGVWYDARSAAARSRSPGTKR